MTKKGVGVVTMFSISDLACASSSGIVLIKTTALGLTAVAWRRAAKAARASIHAFRTGLVSISKAGGRFGRSLCGRAGSDPYVEKHQLFRH